MEIWKDIPGFANYEISNRGRVRSFQTGKWKILKMGLTGSGYPKVTLCRDKKHFTTMVHRIVAAAFFGPCPDRYEVNHLNGVKEDNHVDNLEYCTHSQNNQHAYDTGLHKPVSHTEETKKKISSARIGNYTGEDNVRAKLLNGDVLTIRSLRNRDNIPRKLVAELFGVHISTVYNIETKRTWVHI